MGVSCCYLSFPVTHTNRSSRRARCVSPICLLIFLHHSSLILSTCLDGCSHLRVVIWFPFSPIFNPFSLQQPEGLFKTKIGWCDSPPWNVLCGTQNKIQAFVHSRLFFEFLNSSNVLCQVAFCVSFVRNAGSLTVHSQRPATSVLSIREPRACASLNLTGLSALCSPVPSSQSPS